MVLNFSLVGGTFRINNNNSKAQPSCQLDQNSELFSLTIFCGTPEKNCKLAHTA